MRPRLWPVCQKHSYVLRLWEILFHNILDQHVFPSLSHCCTVKVLIKTKPHLPFFVLSFFFLEMIERFNESMFSTTQNCGTRYSNCVSKILSLWCWIFHQIYVSKNSKVMTIKLFHRYLEVCYKGHFSMIVYHNKLHTHNSNKASGKSHTEVLDEMNWDEANWWIRVLLWESLIHLLQNAETPAQLQFCSCKTLKPQHHNAE